MLTIMTGHRSLAEIEAKLERSEVRYWAGRRQLSVHNKDDRPTYEFSDRIPSFMLFFLFADESWGSQQKQEGNRGAEGGEGSIRASGISQMLVNSYK